MFRRPLFLQPAVHVVLLLERDEVVGVAGALDSRVRRRWRMQDAGVVAEVSLGDLLGDVFTVELPSLTLEPGGAVMLAATFRPVGDGTLLDNTMVMYGSISSISVWG